MPHLGENNETAVQNNEQEIDLSSKLAEERSASTYQVSEELRERTTKVSEDQISSGVTGNIRDAIIMAAGSSAYAPYFEKINQAENGEIPLHHAIGTKNVADGRVVSFNVAGSGFSQPMRLEKGLGGKTNVVVTDGAETIKINKSEKGHVYAFANQDGTKEDLLENNSVQNFARERTEQTYGHGDVLGMKNIREKVSDDGCKVKYTISGPRVEILPSPVNGWFNLGDYKIEKTREYIFALGDKQLDALNRNKEFKKNGQTALFTFTGHSRGGVGVLEGAMRLKYLIQEKYPELVNHVRFELLLYDPVPGPEMRITSGLNHAINVKEQTAEMKAANMLPLDEKDHTTVMYSMGCNHKALFSPMKVMGADTVILTGHSHDEGLKDIEQQHELTHRKAYVNAENGEAYRASGLCEMPKGVYISDENNVMVPVKDVRVAESVIDRVYTRADKAENTRIRRVLEVCNDVSVRAGGTASMECIVRGFNAHDPFYVRSSKEFRAMREGFEDLNRLLAAEDRNELAIVQKMDELKKRALDYITLKNGKGPHSNRTQGRLSVAKNLVSFLDHTRATDMKWYSEQSLDQTPKTNDIRAAYFSNAQSSLMQNQDFMRSLCEARQNKKPMENDLFRNTLASMMADRFFLTHQKVFAPHPMTDTVEHPEKMTKLDTLLGNGNNSLYEVFSNSLAVNRFVGDMLSNDETLNTFSDPKQTLHCLDALTQMVAKEVEQNSINPQSKAQEDLLIASDEPQIDPVINLG